MSSQTTLVSSFSSKFHPCRRSSYTTTPVLVGRGLANCQLVRAAATPPVGVRQRCSRHTEQSSALGVRWFVYVYQLLCVDMDPTVECKLAYLWRNAAAFARALGKLRKLVRKDRKIAKVNSKVSQNVVYCLAYVRWGQLCRVCFFHFTIFVLRNSVASFFP